MCLLNSKVATREEEEEVQPAFGAPIMDLQALKVYVGRHFS